MSNTKRGLILLLVLAGLAHPVSGQVLSLDSILLRIREQNPMLRQYERQSDAAYAYAEGARAWMPPMLGVGTFMAPLPYSAEEVEDRGMLMLSLQQDLPNPTKQRARREAAEARALAPLAAGDNAWNMLRTEARMRYYEWLVLLKREPVLRELLSTLELMKKLATLRYTYNQDALGNIFRIDARIEEVRNELLMVESEQRQLNIELNALMNRPLDDRFTIDTTYTPPAVLLPRLDSTVLAARRSDVREVDRSILAMQAAIRNQSVMGLPDFGVRFEPMIPFNNEMPFRFSLMAMVRLPLAPWSAREYRAEIAGMRIEIESMRRMRESLLLQAEGRARALAENIASTRQRLDRYDSAILPALRRNFDAVRLAYEENTAQLPVLVEAWEALNMTAMDYLDLLDSYYQLLADYERETES